MKKSDIKMELERLLWLSVSTDYTNAIVEAIIDDVFDDVFECADHDYWNEDDVRLAIGRVLMARLCNQ